MTLDCVVGQCNLVQGVECDISGPGIVCQLAEADKIGQGTHLMLLSLFPKNLPRILIAMTRRPLSDSISKIVKTVSYRIEFPTFLDESVFVATYKIDESSQRCYVTLSEKLTCARMSFIASLASASPCPRCRRRCRIFTCRKGSVMPPTSCSGL